MSSFVWVVHDGMRLDIDRDLTLYQLSEPRLLAVHLRRDAAPGRFPEPRVRELRARAPAAVHRHGSDFPQEPALAGDAIHLRYEGWSCRRGSTLQRLIPIIEERIAAGTAARVPQQTTRAVHPAFAEPRPG